MLNTAERSPGHHEWACFACHQAGEKALKALHLHHVQQSWGHGFGRSFRDLPPPIAEALATEVQDLEDRLRILDALYIPTRFPAKAEPPVCWPVRQLCTGYGVVALK